MSKKSTFKQETFKGIGNYSTLNKNLMSGNIGDILYKNLRALQIFIYFNNQYDSGAYNEKSNSHPKSNKDNLSYPKSEYIKLMDKRTFDKNIDFLINLGLLRIVKYRYKTRECTIYGLSEEWINYGTKFFKVKNNDKRIQNKAL